VPTFGGHAQLPPAKLEDLLASIGTGHRRRGRQLHDAPYHGGGHRGAQSIP
jgi:hypothetical protein